MPNKNAVPAVPSQNWDHLTDEQLKAAIAQQEAHVAGLEREQAVLFSKVVQDATTLSATEKFKSAVRRLFV